MHRCMHQRCKKRNKNRRFLSACTFSKNLWFFEAPYAPFQKTFGFLKHLTHLTHRCTLRTLRAGAPKVRVRVRVRVHAWVACAVLFKNLRFLKGATKIEDFCKEALQKSKIFVCLFFQKNIVFIKKQIHFFTK
jgi:hypothetical protein